MVADLEGIGLPRFAIEQIMIHFGKAVPVEFEPMVEATSSEPALPELELGLETVVLLEPELELELLDLQEQEPELKPEPPEPIVDLHGGGHATSRAGKERVQTLLAAEELMKYAEAMAEQGYSFVDDLLEADGEELAQLTKDVQMKKPEARRFLKAVVARKSATIDTGGGSDGGRGPGCPICFELFGDGTVPRMLGCGHSFCEVCLDKMLWPLPTCGGGKTLGCPKCRRGGDVPRGRATELPVNFLVLEF